MRRALIAVIGLLIVLASCTERMICPAYQSAYIYDKDELRKKFSYFLDDSTPKVYATASKTKYLTAEPMSYSRRLRNLQTVRMKPVYVQVPDSLSGKGKSEDSISMDEMRRATQSVNDSTFIVDRPQKDSAATEPLDSIYTITKDKEVRLLIYDGPDSLNYDSIEQRYVKQKARYYVRNVRVNLDEENYLWYLRDEIMLPDVRLARAQQEGEGSGEKAKKEKRGLKGLFKKKKKEEEVVADTTSTVNPDEEEFDYVDEADTLSQTEKPQPLKQDVKPKKEKKGLFGNKKEKKPKKSDAKKPEEEQPEKKKKEDEDDGF